jgi:hypothetical protein
MLNILKRHLYKIIDDIDSGNSSITEEEALQLCNTLKELTHKDERMSKYKAYTYLNISRATFDNYVAQGLLPKGKKEAGYKELSWYKKDLDECATKIKVGKAQKDKM